MTGSGLGLSEWGCRSGIGASPSIMFAPLHPVCTRFSGKVQTRMRAMGVRIEVLERYVQRYVLIRIVVCTICTRNGEPPRGGNPGPGACENRGGANVAVIPEGRRQIREMDAIRGYLWCKSGCKRGARGCKGVNPVNPGGQERPGAYLAGRGSTPVGETVADRIRTISFTPRPAPSPAPPPPRRRPRRPRR